MGKSNAVLPPTGLRLADIIGKVFSADGRQLFWKPSSHPLCDGEMTSGWEVLHLSCLIELLWETLNSREAAS